MNGWEGKTEEEVVVEENVYDLENKATQRERELLPDGTVCAGIQISKLMKALIFL